MIYRRQKILLTILLAKHSKVSKIQLMKWLFLLRKETVLSKMNGFYDFLPYKYGPYSFTVQRDLDEMQRLGLIRQDKKFIWCESVGIGKKYTCIPKSILDSISNTMSRYGNLDPDKLINYVYARYPWYAMKSKIRKTTNPISQPAPPAIYTIGYEGLSIDGFFDLTLQKGLKTVIDVRYNPTSRKYGYSKNGFSRLCDKLCIQYYNFPQLGIPPDYRININGFSRHDYQKLWNFYEREILNLQPSAKEDVIQIIQRKPSTILCFEKEPEKCHRNRLSTILSKETGLKIVHL